ncbi:putative UV-endonuclease UVE-1 [Ophiocordyceps camponoti-floridani]|uniref:Putative UV-endonuclease UVE-1 n=1 Tax=Ophiocordyceps camponoti-floridani TaxID=2030778 RepID=A0A8H4VEB5_9HYPO|nr:putative UV-endonuclease UVE-1 [Ophiocordyceps camponoti-floridani]
MPPAKRKRSAAQPEGPTRRSTRTSRVAAALPDPTDDVLDSKEAVARAVHGLSEMEQRLHREVRKQRLAVENSDLCRDKPKTSRKQPDEAQTNGGTSETHGADVKAQTDDVAPEKGARRPPAVNSERLPLPWTGRLGYACLNTYLRAATPPVFCSRTCRLSSIVDHRHPLTDPSQPEHATKNRPDKTKPADVERGLAFVQSLGVANAADIPKMLRWNDKYGIKFMRLSSEMFPFASHKEHGYKLAPFASDVLAEAGRVAGELGHRLTTHPGQYTQIGSPRPEVVKAAVRDLEYHDEMLSLLKLPEQQDRDAVMILHMGGMFGDKSATLDRFRREYALLSDGVKRRLVLENDDVVWSVHDLLPICEELDIPLVLDFHHHNIVFDPVMREGTRDIIGLFDRIKATWTKKGIRQKMHYSESVAGAVTSRNRRKHSARVKTLPPCASDMDLMIEAKDKEQAVFELMRTFKLPGWDLFNDVVPYERDDEPRKAVVKKIKKGKKASGEDQVEVIEPEREVAPESVSMGGTEKRVYWPEGMEEWLRPKKRQTNKADGKEGADEGMNGDEEEAIKEEEDEWES